MILFLVGLLVGGVMGWLIAALCVASAQSDDEASRIVARKAIRAHKPQPYRVNPLHGEWRRA